MQYFSATPATGTGCCLQSNGTVSAPDKFPTVTSVNAVIQANGS